MIRWILKWLLRLALVVAGLLILLLLSKNAILCAITESRLREETGLEVRIGKFSSALLRPVVTLENVRVYNSPEFGGSLFLNIPELHMELDRLALARRDVRFTLVRLNVAEVDLVRNEAGKTNVFSIAKSVKERIKKRRQRRHDMLNRFEFAGIDVFNLTLGTVKYFDLKTPPNNRDVRIHMQNEVFKDVDSEADGMGILFMIWLRSEGKLGLPSGSNPFERIRPAQEAPAAGGP